MYEDKDIYRGMGEELLKDSIQTCIYYTEVHGCAHEQAWMSYDLKTDIK
jgi:hypothetical protein